MKFRTMKVFILAFLIVSGTIGIMFNSQISKAKTSSGYAGSIRTSGTILRKGKSSSSKRLAKLNKGTRVTVYYTTGNWRKISYKNTYGYVPKSTVYISTKAPSIKGKTSLEKGKTIASFAKRFTGNKYVYGKTDLNNGTDCSGFVRSVYQAFGYNLPRTSSAQRSVGRKVKKGKLQAGDIICYSGHVAIYIGGGKIVHASNRKTGIKISDNYRYRKVCSIRRIVSRTN